MKNFRCIYVNCFNRLRFHAETTTKLSKMDFFGQLKDHNSGKKNGNQANGPIFFIYFFCSKCSLHSFLYLKIAKIYFDVILPLVHSGLQNTLFLCKSYQFGQPIILFQKEDTLNLLKIHILFCPLRGAKNGYQLMD